MNDIYSTKHPLILSDDNLEKIKRKLEYGTSDLSSIKRMNAVYAVYDWLRPCQGAKDYVKHIISSRGESNEDGIYQA